MVPTPHGALPADPLAGNWFLLDLSGTPSGGDPAAMEALVEALASDPTTDDFVSVVFSDGDGVFKVATPNVLAAFQEAVPQATVLAGLASAALGTIVESDWLRPNVHTVEGASRSGITVLDRANALAVGGNLDWATVDWMIYGPGVVNSVAGSPVPVTAAPVEDFETTWQPDWLRVPAKASCIPLGPATDEFFADSWGLSQPSDIDVDAEEAWADCSGDDEILLSVLDSGVDPDHPDLAGRVVMGADFTDECPAPPCDGRPQVDCDEHGVLVAGQIAAAANLVGTLGLAPNVKILAVRIGVQYPAGFSCYGLSRASWAAKGILYSADQGALGTNLSWNWSGDPEPPMVEAYQIAFDRGVFNVNSAGNHNDTKVHFPGNMAEVMSISGIKSDGGRMFVNGSFASNSGPSVTIAAPGQDILTTDLTGGLGLSDGSGSHGDAYAFATGTSFAAPLVTAAAGLAKLMNPALGPGSLELVLRMSAVDYGDPGRDDIYGDGVLNAGGVTDLAPQVVFSSNFETGRLSDWSLVVEE